MSNTDLIAEATAVKVGLLDTADLCTPEQAALAARLRVAAATIGSLIDEVRLAEFQALTNKEIIDGMVEA